MARRNQMGGVSDRHAMLSAYGYGQPPASGISPSFAQQQQQQQRRAPSPFEQPYGSGASTPSSSTPVWGASSSSATGTSSPSPWHAKKDDDLLPRPGSDAQSSASSASKWWPRSSDSRLAEQLEEGNDERLQGLSDRVKILKGITMGIGNEVREGTKDLDSLVSRRLDAEESVAFAVLMKKTCWAIFCWVHRSKRQCRMQAPCWAIRSQR